MTIFRSNYFQIKLSFFSFFLNIRYIYANVFKIFKFELNPLDNKKDIGLYVLFRTFSGHFMTIFRSNYFHLRNVFFIFFSIFVKYMLMYLRFPNLNSIHWIIKKI
jgi:hypothetical protein